MTHKPQSSTVRTLDHVGLTVPDLESSVGFFVGALGFEKVFAHAPKGSRGDIQVRQFARHPETQIVGIVMLRLGTLNLEVFQFEAPDQVHAVPRISDWGGAHLAFYVDDLDAAIRRCESHGAQILGVPMNLPGPESGEGNRFVFMLAPGNIPMGWSPTPRKGLRG